MASYSELSERFKRDVSLCDKVRGYFVWAGFLFALLGVIWDAANITRGLTSVSWFLLAVVSFLASITPNINWAMAMYLHSIEKGKKKE
jgi:hypothetical protein